MNRVILTPATLPSSALAELKQWLGITTDQDDAPLAALLAAALETCEAFTGLLPLETVCEEILSATPGWQLLSTRPVRTIISVETVARDATRSPLAQDGFDLEIDTDATAHLQLRTAVSASRLAVQFTAGLAANWDSLPNGLRHGLIRLAAHQHRERDGAGAAPLPPASVVALWRPWRRMRLL